MRTPRVRWHDAVKAWRSDVGRWGKTGRRVPVYFRTPGTLEGKAEAETQLADYLRQHPFQPRGAKQLPTQPALPPPFQLVDLAERLARLVDLAIDRTHSLEVRLRSVEAEEQQRIEAQLAQVRRRRRRLMNLAQIARCKVANANRRMARATA